MAHTVAWGWLRSASCGLLVVRHGSQPAWQTMASLLAVVGPYTPHSLPQGGQSYQLIVTKPPLVRGLEWGCTAHQRSPHLTGLPSWKSEMCSGQTSRSFTTSVTPATDATVARSLSAALGEIGPLSVTRP